MENNIFGGLGNLGGALGGLVSGLAKSGLAPADDPAVKMINAQSELGDLQNQESGILVEIGKQAFEQTPTAWPQADKLRLIRSNMAAAQDKVESLKLEMETKRR